MEIPQKDILHRRMIVAIALLLILIFLIYSNTFQAGSHLDDYQNIVTNPRLKMRDLSPGSIKQTFFSAFDGGAYLGKKLYRPAACLTFGLNYYFGKLDPAGYHLVNIMVHFLTAVFLFLTILTLFRSPRLRGGDPEKAFFIAILSAALWAVNPIQTQAVTYIVQRMAAMVTLFYLMGLFYYIKGRLEQASIKKRVVYFTGAFLSFLLALGSKENAALWPAAVLLVEIIFFQDLGRSAIRKRFVLIFGVSVLAVLLIGAWFFLGSGFGVSRGYVDRPFTLMQRLLTEPRILNFYLSQIFYPIPARLSIEHDITLSTSLFHPWTTLPSIFFIILLIGLSFLRIHKRPILSFAILFFFLNHVIEGSIIPLELIFEHRNYLPSLFVFMPIAAALSHLLDHYAHKNKKMHTIMASFITLVIIGFGCGTFIRNLAWATEKSLWEDAIKKAPGSSRPYHNLAWAHYDRVGQGRMSLKLYRKALAVKKHNESKKHITLGNIANIYYQAGDYHKAAEVWNKALALNPRNQKIRYYLASAYIKLGDLKAASAHADRLVAKRPDHPEYLNLKGFILMKQKRLEDALPIFKKCLKLYPNNKKALINRGACLTLLGEQRAAEWTLRLAHTRYPREILPVLWLIDTNVKAGDTKDSDHYLNRLLALVDMDQLISILERRSDGNLVLFPHTNSLYQKIADNLKEGSAAITRLQP
jgi:tetratricopeptide (TPR) repeat protein